MRLEAWLRKLSETTTHIVWKKNRNNYARVMVGQLRTGRLAQVQSMGAEQQKNRKQIKYNERFQENVPI